MICQEVMELMQRDLDQDLNDQEIEMMREHLQQCPQCTAMFERLEQLNEQLINLPKVTPTYSLVDRILPELESIDESRKVSRLQRRKPFVPMKVIAGVVAASVVIVVSAYGGIFNTMNSTQHANNSASNAGTFNSSDSIVNGDKGHETMKVTTSSSSDHNQSHFSTREFSDNAVSEIAPQDDLGEVLEIAPNVPMLSDQYGFPRAIMDSQPEVLMSPNSEYVAVVLSEEASVQIVIYSEPDGVELNASPFFETEEILNVRWSDDSQYLEYDITLQNTVTSHTLYVQ